VGRRSNRIFALELLVVIAFIVCHNDGHVKVFTIWPLQCYNTGQQETLERRDLERGGISNLFDNLHHAALVEVFVL
jgi:hypothetical protein